MRFGVGIGRRCTSACSCGSKPCHGAPLWRSCAVSDSKRAPETLAERFWSLARGMERGDDSAEPVAVVAHVLVVLDALAGEGPYLFGAYSAADVCAYPFLKYALHRDASDDEPFHVVLDTHQSLDGRPRLAAWIARISAEQRGL